MIPFCKSTVGEEEIEASNEVVRSGWLVAGKETEAFEKEFADYVGAKYAIFTGSGTSALKMAYKWFKETLADPLITPENAGYYPTLGVQVPRNTYCATYSAASEGGVPWSYHEEPLKNHIHRVNVHYGGVLDSTPCLIEDSAHRIEQNDPLIGKIRCHSLYITKNMTTLTGSGGMFVTNDKDIYETARLYWRDGLTTSTADRLRGFSGYEVKAMAGGYDSNDVAAASARIQLRKLPEFTKRRNEIVRAYNDGLGQDWTGNNLYPYMLGSETEVYKMIPYLRDKGIQASHHYPGTGWAGISLPLHPLLTDSEVEQIIEAVKSYDPA